MIIKLQNAQGCAWRAYYLYVNGEMIAHLGIDPNNGSDPKAFGGIGSKGFRFRLPTVRWKNQPSEFYLWAYKLSSNFWHGMDGRYGWGT